MKKSVKGLTILLTALLVISCTKTAPENTVQTPVDSNETVQIVNLVENAVTRTEINTAEKWGERVIMGQVFEYLGETRNSTASDLRDSSFHKARLHKPGGKYVDLWVYDWHTVLNAVPAVVIANAIAYKSDSLAAIEGTRIPVGTLVAAGPESNGFVEAAWFAGETKKKGLYLERTSLSYDEVDVAAARMLYMLQNKDTKEDLKATLLESALSNLRGSALYSQFEALSTAIPAAQPVFDRAALLASVQTVNISGTLVTTSEMNVRDKPMVSGSTVLKKIPSGTRLPVTLRTDALDTVAGVDSYWFFVEEQGWVFGGYGALETE